MTTVPGVTPRPRQRLTLASVLAVRDASIAARPRATALAGLRAKRALAAARGGAGAILRACVQLASLLAILTSRHGLVVGALGLWTTAAWWWQPIAGLIVAGAGLFFLEARRR